MKIQETRTIEIIGKKEYRFDPDMFKQYMKKYCEEKKKINASITMEYVKGELADAIHMSTDAITNWMYGRTGVSSSEIVKGIANFLKIDYMNLLAEKEKRNMSDNVVSVETGAGDTKYYVRAVYQKIVSLVDSLIADGFYEDSVETFKYFIKSYRETMTFVRMNMLDIPINIYDRFCEVMSEIEYIICGPDEGDCEIWGTEEYSDFCDKNDLVVDSYQAMGTFLELKSNNIHNELRAILDDFLLR